MLRATRGGPAASTIVREVASRGRPAVFAAVAEVWGASDLALQRDLERRLLVGLAGTIEQTHGSATLRLRNAFQRVDRWLVDVVQPELGRPAGALIAGLTAALAEDGAIVVAQTGPGFVWLPLGGGEWLREPTTSPWLTAAVQTNRPAAWAWPALGQGVLPSVAWSNASVQSGDGVLLVTTAGAGLGASAVAALVAAPETDVMRLASTYLPPEAAFVRLALPGAERAVPAPVGIGATSTLGPRLSVGERELRGEGSFVPHPSAIPTSYANDEPPRPSFRLPAGWLKGVAGYVTRLLVAILPVRTEDDDGGYRLLAARFAAALALLLPVLVVVLTWLASAGAGR